MSRGSSDQFVDDFDLIATRGGDVRGTALEGMDSIELDEPQWAVLAGLVDATYEIPREQGYPSELVAEILDGTVEQAEEVAAGLEEIGLLEQTGTVLAIETGLAAAGQARWRVTPAGVQLAGAFAAANWGDATVEFED